MVGPGKRYVTAPPSCPSVHAYHLSSFLSGWVPGEYHTLASTHTNKLYVDAAVLSMLPLLGSNTNRLVLSTSRKFSTSSI